MIKKDNYKIVVTLLKNDIVDRWVNLDISNIIKSKNKILINKLFSTIWKSFFNDYLTQLKKD